MALISMAALNSAWQHSISMGEKESDNSGGGLGGSLALEGIIVAAGGQTDAGPPPHVAARLDRAIELYKASDSPKPKIITTAAGTPHKPSPHDEIGFERHESSDNARYMIDRGVPPYDIYEEGFSLETVGNAFFARVMHCDTTNLRNLVIVNSEFHMDRTRAVFDFVFGVAPVRGQPYSLSYEETENHLPADVLEARRQKELVAVPNFAPGGPWQAGINSLHDLHQWIHDNNTAYAAKRLLVPRKPLDPKLLKSY